MEEVLCGAVMRMGCCLALMSGFLGPAHDVRAQKATMLLQCNVENATVLLDGETIGSTNADGHLYDAVPVGRHHVVVQHSGYETWERTVRFAEGLTTPVECELKRASSSTEVLIDANVGGATVFLDGRRVGRTHHDGKLRIRTSPGTHELRIQGAGFETLTRTFRVAENGLTKVVPVRLSERQTLWTRLASRWQANIGSASGQWSLFIALALLGGIVAVTVAIVFFLQQEKVGESTATGQFDRYRLLKQIGRGGMATVYLAEDTRDQQRVALKIMEDGLLHDADLVWKFLKEGEALQRIHETAPSAPVVRALRYGREYDLEEGRPYIALEYLPGENLSRLIQREGYLPLTTALDVIRQICRGLEAAHANQIWHRDVTPDNVIASGPLPDLKVTLIDFGVAKHEYTARKTLDGSITGKPPYMSPEQCRGESVTGKSDVYSLGILAYVLLTGSPPFLHRNPLQVMKMHQEQAPPSLPERVPLGVRELVEQMLSKQPTSRPSVASIARRIASIQVGA